jgi:hypothetical protein
VICGHKISGEKSGCAQEQGSGTSEAFEAVRGGFRHETGDDDQTGADDDESGAAESRGNA